MSPVTLHPMPPHTLKQTKASYVLPSCDDLTFYPLYCLSFSSHLVFAVPALLLPQAQQPWSLVMIRSTRPTVYLLSLI